MKSLLRPAAVVRLVAAVVTCVVVTAGARAAGEPAQGAEAAEPADAAEAPKAAGPKAITVDAVAQARFGVTVSTLKGVAAPTGAATTARVLDPGPLLRLDSDLAAAAAGFAASRAEALRARKLFSQDRTVSARVVEAATAQEQADLQRVNAAHRELALQWGGGVADLQAHRRAELLDELSGAKAELVRVEIPTESPIPRAGSSIEVRGNSAAEVSHGTVLGTLPTADPRLQTRGVLVELKGGAATLPIGQMLSAEVPSVEVAGADGVILPRAALLRRDARVWVYVQTAPTAFVRREVRDFRPVLSGWFVAKGFAPGERVVATGAAALLGVESPAPADTDTD
jgi:hypothetical protein